MTHEGKHQSQGLDAERGYRGARERSMTRDERITKNRAAIAAITEILEHVAILGEFTGRLTFDVRRGVAAKLEVAVGTGAGLDWKLPTLGSARSASG